MNLLHSIKAHKIDSFINVVIEIPKGSKSKIEYDIDHDKFKVDRILSTELSFPFNYGFVPETWSMDNDPLDAVVLSTTSFKTGDVITAKIIGLLATKDEEGRDTKLITVSNSETNPFLNKIEKVEDLDQQTQNNIQYFYKNYKIIEPGKWVDIDGYFSKNEAELKLSEAIENYHQHFQK